MTPRPRPDRTSRLHTLWLGLCLGLAAITALPAGAQAAPPDNDAFADAQVVRAGDRITANTAEATPEAGEPAPSDPPYTRSTWYRLTPSAAETLRIDTCSGGPWSELTIYTGTGLGALTATPLVSRTGCSAGSRAYLDVAAATTYFLRVAGHDLGGGAIVLDVARPQAPANDNFEHAQPVGRPAHITASNVDATVQAGEPEPPLFGGGGRSVWYKLAATTSDVVVASTSASPNGSMVAVFTGAAVNRLTEVGREGGPTGQRTTMLFATTPGTTYYIAVRGYGDGAGDFTLDVSAPDPPSSPPDIPDPPAPPCFPDADLITYTGTHAAGGTVCLRVTKDGTGVAWFSGTNIPGDRCTIPWFADVMYNLPAPVDARRFSFGSPFTRLIGAFPTNRGARGTLQVTQRSARGACHSAPIAWTATTTGTPPWADVTPPSLRLGGATVQRPLRDRRGLVVLARCRGESCGVSASATIAGVKVTAARRMVKTSAAGRAVRLALSARARRALTAALRSRGSLKVRVTGVARDGEGNRATARRTITLRR